METKIKMYEKYMFGKTFILLFYFIVITGLISLSLSFFDINPMKIKDTYIIYFVGSIVIIVIFFRMLQISLLISPESIKKSLIEKLANQETHLHEFEVYLENTYKVIPEKEENKLKKLKAKVYLTKQELNLISFKEN